MESLRELEAANSASRSSSGNNSQPELAVKKEAAPSAKETARMTYAEKKEYEKLVRKAEKKVKDAEADISSIEAEIKEIEDRLSAGETCRRERLTMNYIRGMRSFRKSWRTP